MAKIELKLVSPEMRARAYVFATCVFGLLTLVYMGYGVFPSLDGVQSLKGEVPDDVVRFAADEYVLAGLIFNTLISYILSTQVSEHSQAVWQKLWADLTSDEDNFSDF